MNKKKVAFVCVHNSCRSQIAEALGKHLAGDVLECYSAGTETKPQINQDAVRLMKKLYNIDMEKTQYSKTYDKIPTPDIAISMGCDVGCPYIGRNFDDNWGLPDPTGCSDDVFVEVISEIQTKIIELKKCIVETMQKEDKTFVKTPLEDKGLLSVKEMCAYLSIGQAKCRELLADPANGFTVRIGNRLYAHRKMLDKWLENQIFQ